MDLDWLIVGGGIHGVHLAARLIGEGHADADNVRIVDPGDALLERWRACTETTGMTHLRSPAVHHLDLEPWSLQRFASKQRKRIPNLFAPPYDRPALTLFNAHCDYVIETFGLGELHVSARATSCALTCDGVVLETDRAGTLGARNVVLAIGASDQPRWPAWAPRDHPRVHHIFAPDLALPPSPEAIAIVGGGISAGQLALKLADAQHDVHLIAPHALRKHQFDSDPGWLGPRFMTGFAKEADHDRRRAIIQAARYPGSMPPDVWTPIHDALQTKRIAWHQAHIERADAHTDEVCLTLDGGDTLGVDRVILATGFEPVRPGGTMLDTLVNAADLPCAQCGYPITDHALRWHPRIHVSGPLAELELGPVARNIAGARRAGDRLIAALRDGAQAAA